jgi:hypothetical protein
MEKPARSQVMKKWCPMIRLRREARPLAYMTDRAAEISTLFGQARVNVTSQAVAAAE